jgi:hypothetical protein
MSAKPRKHGKNANAKSAGRGHRKAKKNRRNVTARTKMAISAQVLTYLGIVLTIIAGVAWLISHRDASLWSFCFAIVSYTVATTCSIQDYLWVRDSRTAESTVPQAAIAEKTSDADLLKPDYKSTPPLPPLPQLHVPGPQFTPPAPPASAVLVFLGNSVAWTSTFPYRVLTQGDDDEGMIVVDKNGSGALISAKFFDINGKMVCQLVNNRITLDTSPYYQIERTPHRLKVIDTQSKVALDVEFLNARAIRFLGNFRLKNGVPVIITQERQQLGSMIMSGSTAGDNAKGAFHIR